MAYADIEKRRAWFRRKYQTDPAHRERVKASNRESNRRLYLTRHVPRSEMSAAERERVRAKERAYRARRRAAKIILEPAYV
jgi:hypothetical protein